MLEIGMIEEHSKTVLIDICPITGAAGALAYEETWWHALEVRVRKGCVNPALPVKLGRGPGPCWEEQCFHCFVWMPATPYKGNGHGICMYVNMKYHLDQEQHHSFFFSKRQGFLLATKEN